MKLVIIAILGYILYQMYVEDKKETFQNSGYPFNNATLNPQDITNQKVDLTGNLPNVMNNVELLPQQVKQAKQMPQKTEMTVAGDKLTATDLLPKDENSLWAEVTPVTGSLEGVNLVEAGYHIGTNTIGQTLKNANYQLRSDPPVPKFNVGPFNLSTIEYDDNRRPFEIA